MMQMASVMLDASFAVPALGADQASVHAATSGNTYGNGSSPTNQLDYYKLVYSIVETSIDSGTNIRGVAFWRWDAINTGDLATLSSLDAALTLSEPCLS